MFPSQISLTLLLYPTRAWLSFPLPRQLMTRPNTRCTAPLSTRPCAGGISPVFPTKCATDASMLFRNTSLWSLKRIARCWRGNTCVWRGVSHKVFLAFMLLTKMTLGSPSRVSRRLLRWGLRTLLSHTDDEWLQRMLHEWHKKCRDGKYQRLTGTQDTMALHRYQQPSLQHLCKLLHRCWKL